MNMCTPHSEDEILGWGIKAHSSYLQRKLRVGVLKCLTSPGQEKLWRLPANSRNTAPLRAAIDLSQEMGNVAVFSQVDFVSSLNVKDCWIRETGLSATCAGKHSWECCGFKKHGVPLGVFRGWGGWLRWQTGNGGKASPSPRTRSSRLSPTFWVLIRCCNYYPPPSNFLFFSFFFF